MGGAATPAMLEVGRVGRPHGLRGDLLVHLVSNRPERSTPGVRFTTDAGGTLLVVSARPSAGHWVMHFEGVDTREAAEVLRGERLLAEPLVDDEALWVHDLVGAEVADVTGAVLGRVTGVLANPASDLLEVQMPERQVLIPLRFVVDRQAGTAGPGAGAGAAPDGDPDAAVVRLTVDLPAGLLDL